ncbi:MAG: long-chain fatty acid--CoA ligase [bacterium]|nr:long-chain fatty acid--CoA ligase [bacterium]
MLAIRSDNLPESVRAVILGGGPIPMDLVERCPQVLPTYGLTEAGSMVTCARPKCDNVERKTTGPALAHAQVKILNNDGIEVANEQVGRIVVRSSGAATEYFRNEKETALTFREGWIHTEDAGFLDARGYLHVLGRRDRIIVSGGENVSLEEVEAALRALDNVRDSLCVRLEDLEWGHIVAAVIETDATYSLDDLRESLRNNVASHKLPKRIATVAKLPTLANGKPDYQAAVKLFG